MPPASPAVCPQCGGGLQAVALDPDTPPWLCTACARGWWQAEVDAGDSWDPVLCSFSAAAGDVLARCEDERAAQHATAALRPRPARAVTRKRRRR